MMRANTRIGKLAAHLVVVGACCLVDMSTALAVIQHERSDARPAAHSVMQPSCVRRGDQASTETANFRIYGLRQCDQATWCARRLEALRSRLQQHWLGDSQTAAWSPKCDVIVHATRDAYLRRVPDTANTLGASRIEFEHGDVAARRIDVRADQPGWFDAVLPHELSHLVLADEFSDGTLPAWADEGMAVLADSREKQALHVCDDKTARQGGAALATFMTRPDYPCASDIPAFYGRSVSLVGFLVDRKTPADFVRFLHRAESHGYDAALRECYAIDGVTDLERQWSNRN